MHYAIRDHSYITKQFLGLFMNHLPTMIANMIYVLIVNNNFQFLNPSTQSFANVVCEWSLMHIAYSATLQMRGDIKT